MTYFPGVCYYPGPVNGRKFDYSVEAIQRDIPVKTVRKFGNTGWQEEFYYVEGDRVRYLLDAGKRVTNVWTVSDNAQWESMPDAEWERLTKHYVANIPKGGAGHIIGNEPGIPNAPGFLRKLKIASQLMRDDGRRVIMGAPYPGAERGVWEAGANVGAFGWVDGVAMHPYAQNPNASLTKVENARTLLNSLGCKKPLHLDECGWASRGGGVGTAVDEATQAQYVTQMFANWRANAMRLNLGNCDYYILNDWQLKDGRWDYRGVIRPDGSHKPSFEALAAA